MPSHAPRSIIITGASAGLGRALALAYAGPGRTLGLVARDAGRLADVAGVCEAAGARTVIGALDVRDGAAVEAWMTAFEAAHRTDLVIANAGVFTGHGADRLETVDDIAWMMRVNLEGVANVVQPAVSAMRGRRSGHVAIIGSLAALQPLADAPGYSASKAGVMAYGEALREYLLPDKVTVSLVYPGHIETAQVADHVGALPHLWTAEKAAAHIKRKLDRRATFIAFPWQLVWLIRAGRALPWRASSA
jgi:NADP-dependent 3-hydroxy acid dehydrogenase YdfG